MKLTKRKMKTVGRKVIALVTAITFSLQPVLVSAEVIIDKNASPNQPNLQTAPNGVPIVDIAKPSAEGVSHNYYQQFNVDKIGLIFNNSQGISNTQLAGYILGNPNLTNGTAKIIVNEVTSTNPTYLRGYSEIAGNKAELIIANPNGIYGAGFGFINANRAVLTTGQPVFGGNGSLEAFNVNRGRIQIAGDGLDAKQVDQVDLLSKAIEVNAGIWAKNLNVVTGSNTIDHDTLAVQRTAASEPETQVAVDVGALGGMYANKIKLIGTDTGVGVNLGGNFSAQNDIEISAAGQIKLSGTAAAKENISISSIEDMDISGTVNAEKNMQINSQGQIHHTGNVLAGGNNTITAKSLLSTGNIGSGVIDNKLQKSGNLSIVTAETAALHGENIAAGNLSVQGAVLDLSGANTISGGNVNLTATAGDVNHTGASLQADGTLAIKAAGDVINDSAGKILADEIHIAAKNISNHDGSIQQIGVGKSNLTAEDQVENTNGSIVASGTSLTISAGSLLNTEGQILHAGSESLILNTKNIVKNDKGKIKTNGTIEVENTDVNNTEGTITAQRAVDMKNVNLTNVQGMIAAGDAVKLHTQNDVNNSKGTIEAGKSLTMVAQSVNNREGNILSLDDSGLSITAAQSVENTSGSIGGNGDVSLTTAALMNNIGKVLAKKDVNIDVESLENTNGKITAEQDVNIGKTSAASTIKTSQGSMSAGKNLLVNAATFDIAGGNLVANNDINIIGNDLFGASTINSGQDISFNLNGDFTYGAGNSITANRDLNFTVANLHNDGSISAVRNITVSSDNIANNGTMQSGDVNISGNNIMNTGVVFGDTLTITADTVQNNGDKAVIATTKDVNFYAKTSLENKDGASIYSSGNINIAGSSKKDSNGEYIDKTNTVLNQSATIEAEKDINISANTLTNKKREFVTEQRVVSDENYLELISYENGEPRFKWNDKYMIPGTKWRKFICEAEADESGSISVIYENRALFLIGKTVTETKIIKDSPEGKIISAKNLKLRTDSVTNDNSSILAGSAINAVGMINNIATGYDRVTIRHLADLGMRGFIDERYDDTTHEQISGATSTIGGGQAVTIQGQTIQNVTTSSLHTPTINSDVPLENTQTLLPIAKDTNTTSAKQTVANQITLPSNAMFKINTEPNSHYLVETDSRFTNYGNFISSDYMLNKLSVDPGKIAKRLGDGFYEQKLVREQVTELTGRYTLGGYSSAEEQYKALLTNGATYAKEFNLQIGVALTDEQMANLTSDIVWLVEKEVEGQKVLVPQVYLAQAGNIELKPNGAVIIADKVQINATGDVNNGGAIKATDSVNIEGANIANYGGTIDGGKSTQLNAGQNIMNIGGSINADQIDLTAGNDVRNETISITRTLPFMTQTTAGNIASINAGENLTIKAGHDISNTGADMSAEKDLKITADNNFIADSVKEQDLVTFGPSYLKSNTSNIVSHVQGGNNVSINSGKDINLKGAQVKAESELTVIAGGNIDIAAVKDEKIFDQKTGNSRNWKRTRTDDETVIGSTLQGGEAVTVKTTSKLSDGTVLPDFENRGNIKIAGSTIESEKGKVAITAEKDLTIQEVTEKHESLIQTHTKRKGFLSSKTTDTMDHSLINEVKGSTISGDEVAVSAGKDLTVKGSNVVGTNDVELTAANDITITSAKETGNDEHYSYTKKSGLFSGGGLGFTIGTQSTKTTTNEKTLDEVGSTIGSIQGNVTVTADNNVDSAGTNFIAGKDLNITGKNVTIDNTINTYDSQSKYEFKQTGLSVSLGGGVIDTGKSAFNNIDRASEVKDERLKTLYEYQAYKDVEKIKNAKGNLNTGVAVSISVGSKKITSEQTEHIETVNTSDISAGGNINIKATDGDLNLKGTKINAEDITLDAKQDLNIEAAENKQQTTSHTSSSSWSVGGSIGLADKGLSYFGNFNSAKANEKGAITTNTESVIDASGTLIMNSGKDTNIDGSQVKGEKVVADIKGDLNIASKQDTDNYTENNKSIGIGISTEKVPGKALPPNVQGPINKSTTNTNVTGSTSKGKTDSTYASVTDQAGIFAGKDGFDIQVGKNTDLKGAVISSDATPDKNKISTDTLTFSNMENRAQYNSSSKGQSYDSDPKAKLNQQGFVPTASMPVAGDANSTTESAISPGTIEIRNNPTQDISGLSRDTINSLNTLGKIFDKQTVKERQELAGLFGQLAFEEIHKISVDNGWKDGDTQKVALHALVGGIMSELAGSGFTAGAEGAGFNELVQKELSKITDPALRQWASYIIGSATGRTGRVVALYGTKYNDLWESTKQWALQAGVDSAAALSAYRAAIAAGFSPSQASAAVLTTGAVLGISDNEYNWSAAVVKYCTELKFDKDEEDLIQKYRAF